MYAKAAALALAVLPFSFAQISDGFENGWDQTKWPVYAQDCNQGGTVSLDTSTAHTGKNSIKVTSPGGYCGHIFFGTTSIPSGSDLYVRTWIKAANALTSSHVSFITMTDSSLGSGKHLRIGGQNQILMYNRETDDATLPDLSPQGTASSAALPAGSWQCFEYHVGKDGTIETWLNGNAIAGLTAGPNANNPYSNGWGKSYKPSITGVYFGWESYGGDKNTLNYDDVAIGSSRIGCGSGTGTGGGTTLTTTTTTRPQTTSIPITTTTTTTSKVPATTTTTTVTTTTIPANCAAKYAQCGGQGFVGPTCCQSGATCKAVSPPYYYQCL